MMVTPIVIIGAMCLASYTTGEEGHACSQTYPDICTDDQVCESFAPCDLRGCEKEGPTVCGAIQNTKCLKRYRNQCELSVAQCKNHDIQQVQCPCVSKSCPNCTGTCKRQKCY